MKLQSRNPDFAEIYRPSDDQVRTNELALRNAYRLADWRDRQFEDMRQASRRRQQRLTRLRQSYVERRRRVRMRTVRS